MHKSPESHWSWMLSVEKRLFRLESRVRGLATTERQGQRQKWTPRDYLNAGAGIVLVLAALSEKVGWSQVVAGLVRLYGVK